MDGVGPDARFRAAFEHAPVAMAIVRQDTHVIVRANAATAALLGMSEADLVGRPMAEFRDPNALQGNGFWRGHPEVRAARGELAGFSGERAVRRADGGVVWLEVHSAALPSSGPPLCLLHLLDITPRKAVEAERARQQAWMSALAELRLAVLLGSSTHRALALVCRRARDLLQASEALVVVPSQEPGTGIVEAADGEGAAQLVHRTLPLGQGLAGTVLTTGRVVVTGGAGNPRAVLDGLLPADGRGSVLAIPLRTPDVVIGVLCVVRAPGQTFTRPDVEIARSFAEQAAAALHIGELRADRERLRVLEDRERIARDLHDSVIQDLFAAGMALDAVHPLIRSARAADRVTSVIDQLDATIKKIRSTIFELETTDPDLRPADLLRAAVLTRRDQLGFEPKLEVEGDPDNVSPLVVDHLLAVVSEALSNVARHSGASSVTVQLHVRDGGGFTLTIRDDGGGFDTLRVPPGNGLVNMRRRAGLVGGTLEVVSAPGRGTALLLSVPDADADVSGSQEPHSDGTTLP